MRKERLTLAPGLKRQHGRESIAVKLQKKMGGCGASL